MMCDHYCLADVKRNKNITTISFGLFLHITVHVVLYERKYFANYFTIPIKIKQWFGIEKNTYPDRIKGYSSR